jgi:hypothetical protein
LSAALGESAMGDLILRRAGASRAARRAMSAGNGTWQVISSICNRAFQLDFIGSHIQHVKSQPLLFARQEHPGTGTLVLQARAMTHCDLRPARGGRSAELEAGICDAGLRVSAMTVPL